MSDLIRRSVLIDEICRSSIYKWSVEEDQAAHNWSLNIINSQPSVESSKGDLISRADAINAFWEDSDIRTAEVRATLKALPSAELPQGDLISRAEAIEAVMKHKMPFTIQQEVAREIDALPSADADAKMTEEVREALMRLTMCAREECDMCKYKDECGFDFQYNISTENMNTILEALSADAVQGWIPLSHDDDEMGTDFPYERDGEWVIVTDGKNISVERIKKDAYDHFFPNGRWFELEDVIAWMPLPTPYECGAKMKGCTE